MIPVRGGEHRPRGEQGQGMVEYALILALISIVVIAVLGILGGQVATSLQELVDFIEAL